MASERDLLRQRCQPAKTALVVVDVQNDFCDPDEFPAAAGMLPRLQALIAAARGARVRVAYTQTFHSEATDSPVWRTRFDTRPHRQHTCRVGSAGADFHPAVLPQAGDLVVVKHRYSGFHGTSLELMLRAHGVETVVMTGIATNVCVETTARDAFQRDFHVVLASDATATGSQTMQAATEENIRRNFGLVATAAEVAEAWGVSLPEGTAADSLTLARA